MNKSLDEMRIEMDNLDMQILSAFKKRMQLSAEIADYKKQNNLPILDERREKEKLERIAKNIDGDMASFVSKLYLTLADISKEYQNKINS